MVDINEIYKSNSDNIKAEDIGNNMWTVTIKSADVKEFKDKDGQIERKIVLTFHEWEKNLPLNVTNARSIADLYGHNSNAWPGKQIMLFTMTVDFGGRPTLGIRVRAPQTASGPMPTSLQGSPQRPLGSENNYAKASGGAPVYNEMNPPPPSSAEDYVR